MTGSQLMTMTHRIVLVYMTAVCTTEIGRLALKYDELEEMECLVATLSVDPVKSHEEWLDDVVAHCENNIDIKFPIIGWVPYRPL